MPQLIWLYLTTWLYYRTSVRCVALAEAVETVSHDGITVQSVLIPTISMCNDFNRL